MEEEANTTHIQIPGLGWRLMPRGLGAGLVLLLLGSRRQCGGPEAGWTRLVCARAVASQRMKPTLVESGLDGVV